ncbi:MAG: galactokinase [Chitinispirillaceae bacterium]
MNIHSYFHDVFRREPTVIAHVPGRVKLLGNYAAFNDGIALSSALDQNIRVALAPSKDSKYTFISTHFPKQVEVEELEPQTEHAWVNYPLGVCAMLEQAGLNLEPFVALIDGNIPIGVGLSSSSALEVSTAIALREQFNIPIDDAELAMLCSKAETDFVGARCNTQDQLSCFFTLKNHLLFSDYRTQEHRAIPLPQREYLLAITLSGPVQSYTDTECIKRNQQCTIAADYFQSLDSSRETLRDISMRELQEHEGKFDRIAFQRARHIIGENERVRKGLGLLEKQDLRGLGILMYASHSSSQDDFENSSPELDMLVDIARGIDDVYGSSLTGKGFGGATVTLLKPEGRNHYDQALAHTYPARAGKEAKVIYTKLSGKSDSVLN